MVNRTFRTSGPELTKALDFIGNQAKLGYTFFLGDGEPYALTVTRTENEEQKMITIRNLLQVKVEEQPELEEKSWWRTSRNH